MGWWVHGVVETQWPLMRDGHAHHGATAVQAEGLFKALQAYEPSAEAQKTSYQEVAARLNDLAGQRRDRLEKAGRQLPPLLQTPAYGGARVITPLTCSACAPSLRSCRYGWQSSELGECRVDPFMTMVLSAVGTVASSALSGAGGEMGRRSSERLFGLLSRARPEDEEAVTGSGEGGGQTPALPVTESEQRTATSSLAEVARRSPEFAREVMEWAREAEWLAPRSVPAVAHGASRPQDAALARVCLDKAIAAMDIEGAELQLADAAELRARCNRISDRPAEEADDLRTAAVLYEKGGDQVALARVRARLAEMGLAELGE